MGNCRDITITEWQSTDKLPLNLDAMSEQNKINAFAESRAHTPLTLCITWHLKQCSCNKIC